MGTFSSVIEGSSSLYDSYNVALLILGKCMIWKNNLVPAKFEVLISMLYLSAGCVGEHKYTYVCCGHKKSIKYK